jgi:hypothetical protein
MTTLNVVFTDLWLTDVSNPSVSVHASFTERVASTSVAGQVRTYAGGRRRVITTPADTVAFPLTLQAVTAAEVAVLEGWRGKVVLLRDTSGRRVFGSFMALDVRDTWTVDGPLADVGLTVTQVDYSEAV